jgi:2,3,4,5-tetrahydropyridine-2-carboxylate N-succinyltransferase
MQDLIRIIDDGFDNGGRTESEAERSELVAAVDTAVAMLDSGTARVAEKIDGDWQVHQWLKKAVLLSFRLTENEIVDAGHTRFYDKVPLKYADYTAEQFARDGVRVVPDAIVRRGAYVAPDVVLMPSYVNIGANIDSGTMVDTWATVGSCAQIGRNVHLSGGVGIGGVLEPVQAGPTIASTIAIVAQSVTDASPPARSWYRAICRRATGNTHCIVR